MITNLKQLNTNIEHRKMHFINNQLLIIIVLVDKICTFFIPKITLRNSLLFIFIYIHIYLQENVFARSKNHRRP